VPRKERRVEIEPKPSPRFRSPLKFCVYCFTPLELEVMNAMFHDATVKGMAQRLNKTSRTVKHYRAQLIRKFAVDSFDNLLAYLLKLDFRNEVHAVLGDHKSSRPDRRTKSGRRAYFARYREAHRDAIRQNYRKWYERHIDEARQSCKEKAKKAYWNKKREQGLNA
jgi:DNA-binding CsgD family transcriptional regulator